MAAGGATIRSGRRSRLLAPLTAALLLTGACGARWSDDERAAVLARHTVRSEAADPTPQGATADAVDLGGVAVVVPGEAGPAGTGNASGSAPSSARSQDASALPCAAASSAPGVTDRQITIAGLNSLSGPVPGLGASALAATQAYVAHRNATGGVCGRQVALRSADDGASEARNRALVTELEPQVLGFVGGIAGGDSGGATVVAERRIPFLGNSISPVLRKDTPTYFGVNMPLADERAVLGKFRFLRDQGVTKAAVVYSSPAVSEGVAQRRLIEAAGIDVVLDLSLPIATLSYDSAARSVANSGAQYMVFVHEAGASASMARALSGIDSAMRFPEYIVAYGGLFVELAGDAAEGATTWLYTLPNEDAGTNAELDAYLAAMRRTAPTANLDTFAAVAWVAAKAFLDTLEAIPGPISREALLAQAAATTTYDADGMLGPMRFSAKASQGCLVGVVYRGGAWRRLAPAQGFLC